MTDPTPAPAARKRAAGRWLPMLLLLGLGACLAESTPSPAPTSTERPSPSVEATEAATARPTPSPTPEPPLSLALPPESDDRRVRVTVAPEVAADGGGRIVVTVANLSDERIAELVLRWPTDLDRTLFLAPFEPSQQRIANGGPPLLQDWTKWVIGPGEQGEPAGTTSLGWGPLDPEATLTIPVLVTRRTAGPVAFDLQVLAGEAILTTEDAVPAELRVAIP